MGAVLKRVLKRDPAITPPASHVGVGDWDDLDVYKRQVGIFECDVTDAVVIADHLVGPCPLVVAIVGIDFFKPVEQLF